MFGCSRIALRELVRLLLERSRCAVHRAEEPRLEAADRIDALVEEALLVAARVFVDGGDPILVDDRPARRDRRPASTASPSMLPASSSRHRNARISTDFWAPRTRSRIAWNAVSPEPSTRSEPPSIGVGDRVQRRRQPDGLHLPDATRPPAAKRARTSSRTAGHLDPIRLSRSRGRVN